MNRLKVGIARFLWLLKDRSGVSTVEYALIVVMVIAIIGGGVTVLSGGFDEMFKELATELKDAQTTAAPP
ncbi:MAG: Flp family type IVb pilin [Gammaproteobacteria bacterium]|nr:Flp family type IVb pilin [Gammaproteobacteria bacterium]